MSENLDFPAPFLTLNLTMSGLRRREVPFRPPRELKHSCMQPSWPCSAQPRVYMSPCSVSRVRWSLPACVSVVSVCK